MSIEFNNAYQEILFENLTAIIKQNFIFQTQLKMNEKIGEEKQRIEKLYQESIVDLNGANEKLKQLDNFKELAEQNGSNIQEKNRIQQALNESMQKSVEFTYEIDKLNGVILTKNITIDDLQNNLKDKEEIINATNKKIKELENKILNLEKQQEASKKETVLDINTATSKKPKTKQLEDFVALKRNDGSSF